MPTLVSTKVKAKRDSEEVVDMKVPVLLPHRILKYLFQNLGLTIDAENLAKFWSHAYQFLPWAAAGGGYDNHMPLTLYGDTAWYGTGYDQSKITGCFMSLTLWRPKSTRMSQWLLFSLDADISLGPKSLNLLYLAIVESLNHAFYGVSPEGEVLPHKFAVCEIKGDWEYHYQTFQLKKYWKTRYICWRCQAENHADAIHSFVDLSDHPTWQATEISHNDWLVNVVKPHDVCVLVLGWN